MQYLYEELGLESIVNRDCECCSELEKRIFQSEYEKLNLMIELKNLQATNAQM